MARRGSKLPEKAAFFMTFTSILLAAQFRSKRFAEYFPPFAVLFAAFAWTSFAEPKVAELPAEFQRELDPYLDVDAPRAGGSWVDAARTAAPWIVGIALAIFWFYNLVGFHQLGFDEAGMRDNISSNEQNDRYAAAMRWATGLDEARADNIPPGEIIFNCNWDDFPKLFFHDTKHRYVYGLDPNYLYSANPELYKSLKDLTEGKIDDPAPVIRDKFGSNYIFTDAKENTDMIAKALESGWVDMVYEDDEARILKIRAQKGDAPSASKDHKPETPDEKKILDQMERNDLKNVNVPDEDEPDN